jgi:hypothetical protein
MTAQVYTTGGPRAVFPPVLALQHTPEPYSMEIEQRAVRRKLCT